MVSIEVADFVRVFLAGAMPIPFHVMFPSCKRGVAIYA